MLPPLGREGFTITLKELKRADPNLDHLLKSPEAQRDLKKFLAKRLALAEEWVVKNAVQGWERRAGWVTDPHHSNSVAVEAMTGCVLLKSNGRPFRGAGKGEHRETGRVDIGTFFNHIRTPGIEDYVPWMYLDTKGNVTVGLGHLIPNAQAAKDLPFVGRPPPGFHIKPAHPDHAANAYRKVKNATELIGSNADAFKELTHIGLSEADAIELFGKDVDQFLDELDEPDAFPEFKTYPGFAKLGLLDLAYNLGVRRFLEEFSNLVKAARRRDWKVAAQESGREEGSASDARNEVVRSWFERAAREERFFINARCEKRLKLEG